MDQTLLAALRHTAEQYLLHTESDLLAVCAELVRVVFPTPALSDSDKIRLVLAVLLENTDNERLRQFVIHELRFDTRNCIWQQERFARKQA